MPHIEAFCAAPYAFALWGNFCRLILFSVCFHHMLLVNILFCFLFYIAFELFWYTLWVWSIRMGDDVVKYYHGIMSQFCLNVTCFLPKSCHDSLNLDMSWLSAEELLMVITRLTWLINRSLQGKKNHVAYASRNSWILMNRSLIWLKFLNYW